MPSASIEYNGFEFNPHTSYEVTETYEYDDAEMTIVGTRFVITAKTIIAPSPTGSNSQTGSAFYAGPGMQTVRQKLSKAGAPLSFYHDGFGPAQYIQINKFVSSGQPYIKDINGGPKPRILVWRPIGNTAAVEVEWTCETTIPICDGESAPRFTGLKAFNYSIQYDFDDSGYQTRRINGYIEIAMTREELAGNNPARRRQIPDTVDNYRDQVRFRKPENFTRQTTWSVSSNKRRADFSIIDTEIRTSNPYPAHVEKIQANHRASWRRGDMVRIPNKITASITLSPLVPRVTAWYIFASIIDSRLAFAAATNGSTTFIESIELDESIFENVFNFSCDYNTLFKVDEDAGSIPFVINGTGMFQPLPNNTWASWDLSTRALTQFRPLGNDYGLANLRHNQVEDKIVDLCDAGSLQVVGSTGEYYYNTPTAVSPFANPCPDPEDSWSDYYSEFIYTEGAETKTAVTLGPDDLVYLDFEPGTNNANLGGVEGSANIERFVEQYAGDIEIVWNGRASRVCYPIPKPGKLTIGDVELVPGKGAWKHIDEGKYFGQRRYRAYWSIPYTLQTRPTKIDSSESLLIPQFYGDEPG